MSKLNVTSLLLAMSLAGAALAETPQDAISAAAKGQIDFTYNRSSPTPAASDRTPLQAKGVRLRDLMLSAPALSDRRGFALHTSVVLDRPPASGAAQSDAVRGSIQSRRINAARTQPDAQGRYPGFGEGPALIFAINKLEVALGYRSAAGFFTLPVEREEQDGLLRFVRSGRDYTVITPPGLKAYQPVSIGDYAADMIRSNEAGGAPDLAAQMRAAASQLSAAQLQAPYCKTNAMEMVDLTTRCAMSGAEPVVRLNPGLALGLGAASRAGLIVLSVPRIGNIGDAQERRRLLLAASQFDLAALRALLG